MNPKYFFLPQKAAPHPPTPSPVAASLSPHRSPPGLRARLAGGFFPRFLLFSVVPPGCPQGSLPNRPRPGPPAASPHRPAAPAAAQGACARDSRGEGRREARAPAPASAARGGCHPLPAHGPVSPLPREHGRSQGRGRGGGQSFPCPGWNK